MPAEAVHRAGVGSLQISLLRPDTRIAAEYIGCAGRIEGIVAAIAIDAAGIAVFIARADHQRIAVIAQRQTAPEAVASFTVRRLEVSLLEPFAATEIEHIYGTGLGRAGIGFIAIDAGRIAGFPIGAHRQRCTIAADIERCAEIIQHAGAWVKNAAGRNPFRATAVVHINDAIKAGGGCLIVWRTDKQRLPVIGERHRTSECARITTIGSRWRFDDKVLNPSACAAREEINAVIRIAAEPAGLRHRQRLPVGAEGDGRTKAGAGVGIVGLEVADGVHQVAADADWTGVGAAFGVAALQHILRVGARKQRHAP